MSDYVNYLRDVFKEFGDVKARRMFGGHGLYFEDCMFGLVADDELYLKVDKTIIHHFEELELPAFEYDKGKGKLVKMSYHLAPETIYDDASEAAQWASLSWEAAKRAKNKKKKR